MARPTARRAATAHVAANRAAWDEWAQEYEAPGRSNWAASEPSWGIWDIPEADVGAWPEVAGREVVELGCGTGYVSAWAARRGGRPVGLDNSAKQLSTARALQREFALEFPLVHGDAEVVPLADQSFDVVISEYGASIWCDPYSWVPEAARLLRPGGDLVFLVNGALLMMCVPDEVDRPAEDRLLRPYFGMHRFEWPDDHSVEFHLGHGDWIRLLRSNGFAIVDLVELRPGGNATTRYPFVTLEWARRWPSEEIWRARKLR
jgi:SAM-dependent methyltransferase